MTFNVDCVNTQRIHQHLRQATLQAASAPLSQRCNCPEICMLTDGAAFRHASRWIEGSGSRRRRSQEWYSARSSAGELTPRCQSCFPGQDSPRVLQQSPTGQLVLEVVGQSSTTIQAQLSGKGKGNNLPAQLQLGQADQYCSGMLLINWHVCADPYISQWKLNQLFGADYRTPSIQLNDTLQRCGSDDPQNPTSRPT